MVNPGGSTASAAMAWRAYISVQCHFVNSIGVLDMTNSARPKMRLSSPAGPLPTAEKGARFPLSAGMTKMSQDIDYNQISGADAAIFENENGFFRCRQRNRRGPAPAQSGAPIAAPFPLHRL
jgi:hypothetical protein